MPYDPGAYFLSPKREPCTRCGEVARGSAHINGERYCHGDKPYPTCYMLENWDRASGQFHPVKKWMSSSVTPAPMPPPAASNMNA